MKFVLFDYETTSNQPATTRGVQLAAMELTIPDNQPEGCDQPWTTKVLYNTLLNPGCDIHHEAAEVHGITSEMVQDAPKDSEVTAEFVRHLIQLDADGHNVILGSQNGTTFDAPIAARLALEVDPYLVMPKFQHVDTMTCAIRLLPKAPNRKLSVYKPEEVAKHGGVGLIQYLKLGTGEGAHDAMTDIEMVLKLAKYFLGVMRQQTADREGAERIQTLEDLARWCTAPRVLRTCPVGKHKGKPFSKEKGGVPSGWVRWACENWTEASLDIQATFLAVYGMRFAFTRKR